ncbi:uncharacterized protein N7479_006287 [Penicillium vulpinum]|uniref:Uncharacterized protein n=1 Tax=Penicillium vulpinum TaxID=29845 RepID=A0A1V6R5I4_9EURO|nr:uncharacterized protein N7479_006287 [Penicillium vulpinum]KAJ5959137.1 hypothetical protein N7479_006287 [Penicillium vulpinum]OQD96774.1 hypothetical protein PENVUL_c087G03957 [Penicillium vulpinum]
MGGLHGRVLLLQSRRRLSSGNVFSRQSMRSFYPATTKRPHDPSPSELLRFALRDSTEPIHDSNSNEALSAYLRGLFVTEWKLNAPPVPLWTSLKGFTSRDQELLWDANIDITDVSSLRSLIERYVKNQYAAEILQTGNCLLLYHALQRCQRKNTLAEILLLLRDLFARLKRLQLPIQPELYSIALYFASLDLSPSDLRHFLDDHRHKDLPALGRKESLQVVRYCSEALDCRIFEDPYYDPNPILSVTTGEEELVTKPHNLHDILFWTQTQSTDQIDNRFNFENNAQDYICLLARLGNDEVLHRCWSHFLENIQPKNYHSCIAAYQIVLALIQNVQSETAVKWLEDISQKCGDNLPFIAKFPNLRSFLSDPIVGEAIPDLVRGEDYLELLEFCLEDMDRRMGVQWSPESESHFSTALDPSESIYEPFQDQLLPKIGNKYVGPDHGGQLYAELRVHGCSKSPAALGRVVDMLNDHDGQSQKVITHLDYNMTRLDGLRSKFESLELRWVPEHSPIEFSNSQIPALRDSSEPTPSTLGLIRARLIIHGVPQMGIDNLHLMQLGCMDMRYGPDHPWQPSGYIVVWDRHCGELLGLYVGQGTGVIDCGPAPSDGPLGALMHLTLSTNPDERTYYPSGTRTHSRNCWGPYYLDVDPSADLEYEVFPYV